MINVDPWWNLAVEEQAFSRVYRIGQEKETYFARILVEDSIDTRIQTMQNEKAESISSSNQEFDPQTQLWGTDEFEALLGLQDGKKKEGKGDGADDNSADDDSEDGRGDEGGDDSGGDRRDDSGDDGGDDGGDDSEDDSEDDGEEVDSEYNESDRD